MFYSKSRISFCKLLYCFLKIMYRKVQVLYIFFLYLILKTISKIRKELCKVLVKTPLWSTKRYFLIILLSTISTLKSIFRKVFWAAVTFLTLSIFQSYCAESLNDGTGIYPCSYLSMSVFEGRLRFRMLYFVNNDYKIILQ